MSLASIYKLCHGLNMHYVDPPSVIRKVIQGLVPIMKSSEVETLLAETCAAMTTKHHDYAILAARIAVSNLHKRTKSSFSSVMNDLHAVINSNRQVRSPLISDHVLSTINKNSKTLDSAIDYSRDFVYSYFGFKTLERSYLLRIDGKVVERPQHLWMRVAVCMHGEDIEAAIKTYNMISQKWFTHASPTLFNAGTPTPQLSSCFLLTMEDDSVEGIFNTLKKCAVISKYSGGIGLNIHNVRAKGSSVNGIKGASGGLIPLLRVYNNSARYIGQGANKRPAAIAVYLEPWHADIEDFLDLRKNVGNEEHRARDLFYSIWVPDLFMKRVQGDRTWSLMCPFECPGLQDCWGEEFEKLYQKYETEGKFRKQVSARSIWYAIVESQIESGTPFMVYKDTCNRKSNQKNLGTIKGSNLCTEVVQFSSSKEIAVCNLASIALNKFVLNREFDFQKLKEVTKIVTYNLNKIIDVSFYPVPEAKISNQKHRPIGIGVQGLADAFILLRYPFDCPDARRLNVSIFETIYYGALEASCELALKYGPYASFQGSPSSHGILQFDMWDVKPSTKWDWASLKQKISKYGLRNSLLIAPMPTASTAQILGNNESIEPYTSNIYSRRVLSGEYQIVNHHLINDLVSLGLWNESMKNKLLAHHGSIQEIKEIPVELKNLYRTAWEIPQKSIIEMAADRAPFIDQSQSLNIHMADPSYAKVTSMHFYGWKLGLKTGMYYLRSKPAANAIQFTVDKKAVCDKSVSPIEEKQESANDLKDSCFSCSA